MRESPLVLHSEFLMSHAQMADGEDELMRQVKDRMRQELAYELSEKLIETPAGMILSPTTWTINDDDSLGAARIAATINAYPLPAVGRGGFSLHGGKMHGRGIFVGDPAPERYLLPWVPPVTVMGTGRGLLLTYRRLPGLPVYEFESEDPA